ncbi:MAG TPA: class I SAM-dependent methyltransferase [Sedimentisphaerales bacterium]|nr:class I SAM-dependent methyltransferase [Sedimentisphaerales bacterium]
MEEFDIGYPHSSTPRVLKKGFRTIRNRMAAAGLDREYYDGRRENGYGGFRYDGRWAQIVPRLAARYGLTSNSAVLDVGCKKGFFLHDLKLALPGVLVKGVENHPYPIEHAMDSVKDDLVLARYEELPFEDGRFDFVMAYASIYMLNLAGVMQALREVQRVGKGRSFVTLGAYKTREGRELLEDWTLLGTTILHVDEWLEVFHETGYTGDYAFTTAESLNLVRG